VVDKRGGVGLHCFELFLKYILQKNSEAFALSIYISALISTIFIFFLNNDGYLLKKFTYIQEEWLDWIGGRLTCIMSTVILINTLFNTYVAY